MKPGRKKLDDVEIKKLASYASSGVKSQEALFWPSVDRLSKIGITSDARLEMRDIVGLIFPAEVSPKYNEIAVSFMDLVLKTPYNLTHDETGRWLREKSFSESTFYNVVRLRLRRAGLIKITRLGQTVKTSKTKYSKSVVSLSESFGRITERVGSEYTSIVAKARKDYTAVNPKLFSDENDKDDQNVDD